MPDPAKACLPVEAHLDGVRRGRSFVAEQVALRGASAMADDAALVAAELLANALQHGEPPIRVCVSGHGESLRLDVHDGSSRAPIRPAPSLSNMTGRGLGLVDAVAARWGVDRGLGGAGKVVWAEFDAPARGTDNADRRTDDPLAEWDDWESIPREWFTVELGDVPTDLLIKAKAHIDNLVRELSLARDAGLSGDVDVPSHLAALIETVVHGFSDARDAIKRQALAAQSRHEPRTVLRLHLPLSAAEAGEAYLAALDEADEYSRAARLLTLETPPDHRLFRRWYVGAVVAQLRDIAAGLTPNPVTPFEEVLVAEVRRLAPAQRLGERLARLQRLTAALARARTPEDVASVVISDSVEALGASGGGLLVPAGDGDHVAVPGTVGYGSELIGALRDERLDAPLPGATALRTGKAVWLETLEERDREFPALRGLEASTVSMCAVPLVTEGRVIGALRFSFSVRKLFDDDERAFILAVAGLTGQTLQRTELYEAERRASLSLQRALLPAEVPRVRGWDVAAYYSPAGGQEAGGDFYDVLELPDGRIVAVVGDVMGRGVEAAAAMAQVRSTIRAYAVDDPDPESVFARVDTLFEALDLSQLVTVLYILADPSSHTVCIGNAGHLPPLLVDSDGVQIVATQLGTPFSVPGRRGVTEVEVPPGSALVAFTDGLVERRGEDIDEEIAAVVAVVREAAGMPAQELIRYVVRRALRHGASDDDVTALVLARQ